MKLKIIYVLYIIFILNIHNIICSKELPYVNEGVEKLVNTKYDEACAYFGQILSKTENTPIIPFYYGHACFQKGDKKHFSYLLSIQH